MCIPIGLKKQHTLETWLQKTHGFFALFADFDQFIHGFFNFFAEYKPEHRPEHRPSLESGLGSSGLGIGPEHEGSAASGEALGINLQTRNVGEN